MNTIFWILQLFLAVVFLMAAIVKMLSSYDGLKERMAWTGDFSPVVVKLIGFVELMGAAGLVLPWWLNLLPVLTPVAAVSLSVVMFLAILTHMRRKESPVAAIVLFVLLLFLAYGRF